MPTDTDPSLAILDFVVTVTLWGIYRGKEMKIGDLLLRAFPNCVRVPVTT